MNPVDSAGKDYSKTKALTLAVWDY